LAWIIPQIAIGHVHDAVHLDPAVDAVVCLKPGCRCGEVGHGRPVYPVPMIDGRGNRPDDIAEAIDLIADVVDACGEKVLVHCHAGRSRSVAIVAAILVQHRGLTPVAAVALVASKRDIYLSPGIEEIFGFLGR
jgi:hypothetical protein